jgi:hypothetical protein
MFQVTIGIDTRITETVDYYITLEDDDPELQYGVNNERDFWQAINNALWANEYDFKAVDF